MKKIFFIFLFMPQTLWAVKAMVIVLEAPLFKEQNVASDIVQYIRKGQSVYIDGRDLKDDPTALTRKSITFVEHSGITEIPIPSSGKQRWYHTLDRNGQTAYILGEHIKVIYNDFREFNEKVALEGHDPTDYRLSEPIADDFPFTDRLDSRMNFTFGMGPGQKSNYIYNDSIIREDYRFRNAFGFNYLWPAGLFTHFRMGLNLGIYNQKRKFILEDGRTTFETGGEGSAGPSINYDQFQGRNFQITYTAGLNLNYARYFVQQETINNASEERVFSGWYFTPKVSATLQWLRIFFDNVDIIGQFEGVFDYNHKYLSQTDPVIEPLWIGGEDHIKVPGGASFFVYIGIQAKI